MVISNSTLTTSARTPAERPPTSPIPLFRQEVVEFQQIGRQYGNAVLLQQPVSIKLTSWIVASIVVLGVVLLVVGQYSRKASVSGYLAVEGGTAKIFALERGTITKVHVREGQEVQEGQSLLTIDTGRISAAGEDVNAAILVTLETQREHLKRQIAEQEVRMTSERERLTHLIQGLKAEIEELETQIPLQQDRIKISESLVNSITELVKKGTVTVVELKRRQADVLNQKQELSGLKQKLPGRQNQLTDTQYSLAQLPIVIGEKIQLLRNELSATEQRIAEISGRRAFVVRSPVAGRITALQASVGKIAEPQDPQLEIVPPHSTLKADLFVPSRAIGFVSLGQQVSFRYDAFPYQNFGRYKGKIVEVSQNILKPSDAAAAPFALKEPVYIVTASLDRQDVDGYGKRMPLQAGMLLQADVILDKRSLARWLLDPLLSARG